MTPDEKMAAQSILLDELARTQQDNPTMLIDALLADQGRAFLHAVLSRRLNASQQATQAAAQVMRAFQQTAMLATPTDDVAA